MANTVDIFKALGNETRLNILHWLKDPEANFPPQGLHVPDGVTFEGGVCVGSIRDKAGISQSTISQYLDILARAGLVRSQRCGKWTYYRREEEAIAKLADYIRDEL